MQNENLTNEAKQLGLEVLSLEKSIKALTEEYNSIYDGSATTPEAQKIHVQIVEQKDRLLKLKRKKEVSDMKRHIQDNDIDYKTLKRPKYIHIRNKKILTPKEIVSFKIPGCLVFGDKRCLGTEFEPAMLSRMMKEEKIIFVLKAPKNKKNKSGLYPMTVPISEALKSRKWRLASATLLPDENERAFMIEELGAELTPEQAEKIEAEELQIKFLTSLKESLLVKDLIRFVQLHYQAAKMQTKPIRKIKKPKA